MFGSDINVVSKVSIYMFYNIFCKIVALLFGIMYVIAYICNSRKAQSNPILKLEL